MDVTMKDTKQVIFDELVAAEKKLKAMQAGKSNPVEEAAKAATKKAVESAAVSVEAGIFSDDLNQKYKDIQEAIKVGEDRIQELYGIEKQLISLTTVINAHKDAVASLEAAKDEREEAIDKYIAEKKDALDTEIAEFRTKIQEEEATLRKNHATLKAELDLERKREKEEYSYNLQRERAKENDAWEDEKAGREAAIAEAEAKVDAAWDEVKSKIDYITELEAKVAEIPTLIEEAKAAGAADATKEAGKTYGFEKAALKKDYEYQVMRLQDKLDAAEADRDKAYDKVESLEEKLDAAYAKIEALAGRTVEAAGGVKIIGSTNGNGTGK